MNVTGSFASTSWIAGVGAPISVTIASMRPAKSSVATASNDP